jgi:NTE family protein
VKRINLALQGGGAHGAFTWGVLDRILAEDDIEIAAISGTSAGALNAIALKAGMVRAGREGARDNLRWMWGRVGAATDTATNDWLMSFGPTAQVLAKAMEYSPAYAMFDFTSRMFSPYTYGPMLRNPLTSFLAEFDFDLVCADREMQLFIGATNVRTGKIKIFSGKAITPDAILASACLPTVFQAVEIPDPDTGRTEAYWDGGYTGNPALFPLFDKSLPDDIVVVNINPLFREQVPNDNQSIQNRINEISFNSSLLRELRAINFVNRLLRKGQLAKGEMKDVLIHFIGDDHLMNDLNVATKSIPAPVILARLHAAGQTAADAFLTRHKADINHRSTVDMVRLFN